jgi:hypothetical protein
VMFMDSAILLIALFILIDCLILPIEERTGNWELEYESVKEGWLVLGQGSKTEPHYINDRSSGMKTGMKKPIDGQDKGTNLS